MDKTRLEAFSDGVLAIIITIMVLEIKIPHSANWIDLQALTYVFISYALSFVFIGIYWNNHHHLIHTVREVSSGVMWANLNLLFWLSLIPFTTGWMGENHFERNTVIVYAISMLLCGLAFNILQRTIQSGSSASDSLNAAYGSLQRKGTISVIAYLAAIGFAFYHTLISGLLFAFVSALWLLPDRRIERALKETPASH